MAALYMAMGLIWKPLKCSENWRWSRKQIQIIWGGSRKEEDDDWF